MGWTELGMCIHFTEYHVAITAPYRVCSTSQDSFDKLVL